MIAPPRLAAGLNAPTPQVATTPRTDIVPARVDASFDPMPVVTALAIVPSSAPVTDPNATAPMVGSDPVGAVMAHTFPGYTGEPDGNIDTPDTSDTRNNDLGPSPSRDIHIVNTHAAPASSLPWAVILIAVVLILFAVNRGA